MRVLIVSFVLFILSIAVWVVERPTVYISREGAPTVVAPTTTTTIQTPRATTTPALSNAVKKETSPPPKKVEAKVPSTPSSTPAPKTTPAPPAEQGEIKISSDFATQIAEKVFEETNVERIKNGLPALVVDTKLALVARAHSADMLASNYFEHTNKSGCNSACRVKNANYSYTAVGENLFMTAGLVLSGDDTGALIVQGWMGSPGHRANILQKVFTRSGIGVAYEGKKIYTTALYSKPR